MSANVSNVQAHINGQPATLSELIPLAFAGLRISQQCRYETARLKG